MRNSNTHSLTIKRNLNKCKSVFNAYNDIQYAYGLRLDANPDVVEFECTVKLIGCREAESYTTDFYCIKLGGEDMVRECIDKSKLLKPMTLKLLDTSRKHSISIDITLRFTNKASIRDQAFCGVPPYRSNHPRCYAHQHRYCAVLNRPGERASR